MTLAEKLTLARAGYKKKEIEEMEKDGSSLPSQSETVETSVAINSTTDAEAVAEENTDEVEEKEDSTDEALKVAIAEIEKLKGDLKKAQDVNTRKEISSAVDDDAKTVDDMVRSFM